MDQSGAARSDGCDSCRGVVLSAVNRRSPDRVQPGEVVVRQPKRAGGDVLRQVREAAGARDGQYVRTFVESPGETDLGRADAVLAGDLLGCLGRGRLALARLPVARPAAD